MTSKPEQMTQSVDTTASVLTENFISEERLLPDKPQKNNMNLQPALKVGDYNTAERAFREFVISNLITNLLVTPILVWKLLE